MAFNFKSTGNLPTTDVQLRRRNSPPSLSIKTPLQIGQGSSGLFMMHTNIGDAIRDNLRNLLLTNSGERLVFCDLGANLRPLLTELAASGGDDLAIQRIAQAVSKYMPFVQLETFVPSPARNSDGDGSSRVTILITYSVPSLKLTDQAIQINMNFRA